MQVLNLSDYQHALIILPIAFAISIVCVYFLKETHGYQVKIPGQMAKRRPKQINRNNNQKVRTKPKGDFGFVGATEDPC